jgi:hypothetical protein
MAKKKEYVTRKPEPFSHSEWFASERPGAGQYNPHDEVKKMKDQPSWDNPKA